MAGTFSSVYRREEPLPGQRIVTCIAPVLQDLVGERVIEVLPALQNIFLPELLSSGPVLEAIQQFLTARQRSGRPVTVHHRKGQIQLVST
jgi:hypothetical protein